MFCMLSMETRAVRSNDLSSIVLDYLRGDFAGLFNYNVFVDSNKLEVGSQVLHFAHVTLVPRSCSFEETISPNLRQKR